MLKDSTEIIAPSKFDTVDTVMVLCTEVEVQKLAAKTADAIKSDRDVLFSQIRGWREENILVDGKSRIGIGMLRLGAS